MNRPERIRAERAASPTAPLTDAALAEVARLKRCINMAMGCLDMFASKDQALARAEKLLERCLGAGGCEAPPAR